MDFKELIDDFEKLVSISECVSDCSGIDCDEYEKSIVLVEKSELERVFNRYFGCIDIEIVGE